MGLAEHFISIFNMVAVPRYQARTASRVLRILKQPCSQTTFNIHQVQEFNEFETTIVSHMHAVIQLQIILSYDRPFVCPSLGTDLLIIINLRNCRYLENTKLSQWNENKNIVCIITVSPKPSFFNRLTLNVAMED